MTRKLLSSRSQKRPTECKGTHRYRLVMIVDDPTRFRWVFCQLETLRQCLPQNVRRTLNELPESLDETYERVMTDIRRANQPHAYRMFQCLAVATRPLTVAELAELLAFDFDVAEGEIPKLNSNWRWEDHEQAVLSTCSSLITIVPNDAGPVVQFSHFSVKEYLMSDRLANSMGDISQYHISLDDAHTLLAQASLSVLLRDPDVTNDADSAPLARYAAAHWVIHAQVENVVSRVHNGMEDLFDPDKPYFETWVRLHDIDFQSQTFVTNAPDPEHGARPLYYAALCGFNEQVEHLTLKYPEYASAAGGRWGTALHSASFAGHLHVVHYLLRHGVGVDVRNSVDDTPLLLASWKAHHGVVQCLLEQGADTELRDMYSNSPLTLAAIWGQIGILRLLLEHGANVNSRDEHRRTPLHQVLRYGIKLDVLRILLEHGADIDAEDNDGETPLQVSLNTGHEEAARLLSGNYSKQAEM